MHLSGRVLSEVEASAMASRALCVSLVLGLGSAHSYISKIKIQAETKDSLSLAALLF
jgi:hypothetical protein